MGYTWKYYDLLLLGVIASLALGTAIGLATSIPLTVSVPLLSIVALGLIGHGMFVNGPVDEPEDLTEEVDSLN